MTKQKQAKGDIKQVQDDCVAVSLGLPQLTITGQIEPESYFEITVRYRQDIDNSGERLGEGFLALLRMTGVAKRSHMPSVDKSSYDSL